MILCYVGVGGDADSLTANADICPEPLSTSDNPGTDREVILMSTLRVTFCSRNIVLAFNVAKRELKKTVNSGNKTRRQNDERKEDVRFGRQKYTAMKMKLSGIKAYC